MNCVQAGRPVSGERNNRPGSIFCRNVAGELAISVCGQVIGPECSRRFWTSRRHTGLTEAATAPFTCTENSGRPGLFGRCRCWVRSGSVGKEPCSLIEQAFHSFCRRSRFSDGQAHSRPLHHLVLELHRRTAHSCPVHGERQRPFLLAARFHTCSFKDVMSLSQQREYTPSILPDSLGKRRSM